MSMKYLGPTLDIHTGGIDHVPIHHTNEIAQSEAVTGEPFAKIWLHSNHVMVNGEKISKSLGNGIRLQDIIERGYSPEAVRLHILESHYRSQSKFSWKSLEAAKNRLQTYRAMADLRFQPIAGDASKVTKLDFNTYLQQIKGALEDDLNTPLVLSILSGVADEMPYSVSNDQDKFQEFLQFIDDALGLNLLSSGDITDQQKALVAERQQARKARDWSKADQLRRQLTDQGITLRDTPNGPIWSRL
jgi:cysteinyl-tRNA synthetase